MAVRFTQFLRPDGRQSQVEIDLPPSAEAKATEIVAAGFRFECEMLSDMVTVSFTITDDEDDHAIALCPNGPAVPDAITKMIADFDIDLARRTRAA